MAHPQKARVKGWDEARLSQSWWVTRATFGRDNNNLGKKKRPEIDSF